MQKGTEYLAITPSPLKRNQRVNHPALSKVAIVTKINKLITIIIIIKENVSVIAHNLQFLILT